MKQCDPMRQVLHRGLIYRKDDEIFTRFNMKRKLKIKARVLARCQNNYLEVPQIREWFTQVQEAY